MRRSRATAALLAIADVALVVVAFVLGWLLRFRLGLGVVTPDDAPLTTYVEPLGLVVVVFHVVFRARGLHDTGLGSSLGVQVVERTLGATALALTIVLAASFFYRETTYSRSAILFSGAVASVLLPLPRLFLILRTRSRRRAGLDLDPAVVVGRPEDVREVAHRLSDQVRFGLALVGVVLPAEEPRATPARTRERSVELVPAGGVELARDERDEPDADGSSSEPAPGELPVLGRTSDLEHLIGAYSIREVLIVHDLEKDELVRAIDACERLDVEPRIVPRVYDLCITAQDLIDLDGVPFIAIRERRFERASLLVKRAFDVVASLVLLVLSAPVLLASIVAIKATSKGPAFFSQLRVGENGRVFRMWKLRSMVADAEQRLKDLVDLERLREPVFKLDRDPRVTRVGSLLRRTSIDELPQLWNVLVGDMSLVGPRPEEEKIVARYDAHQRRRLKAKPGITGLQQVEARGVASLDERIRLDVIYIRRRTFIFDLWILARTGFTVVSGRGAR